MSTLAESIKYVDDSLDVGFKEFNSFMDNNVYSVRKDIEDTIFGYTQMALDKLKSITGQIRDTLNAIAAIPAKIARELQAILDRVMNELLSFDFGGWANYVLGELKLISDLGVKEFFMSATAAGSVILCANMDVLKDLASGWKVAESILEGLILSLSLDWMNRVCKDFSIKEENNMTNYEKIENVYPYPGVTYKPDDVISSWTGIAGGFFDASNGYRDPSVELKSEAKVRSDIKSEKTAFQIQEELGIIETLEQKKYYCDMFDEIASDYEKERNKKRKGGYSKEELKVLELRGDMYRVIPGSRKRISQANNLDTAKDVLGSFIKNLKDVDLEKVPKHKLNDIEKKMLDKMKVIQLFSRGCDFTLRTHTKGSFSDYDFDYIFDLFDEEEKEYILNSPRDNRVYRYNGLHPTSEMFITEGVYYARKNNTAMAGEV